MPSWWDRFGHEWAKSGLTDDPTFAQADAGWAFIGQAPPTVEQFNSMFQWVDDKDNWLYGQIANCILGASMTPVYNDLTQLWNAIRSLQRTKLTADLALYVDVVNGNDVTGNGTTGNPWKTVQKAINTVYATIDGGGHNIIVQLKVPGTYDPFYHNQPIINGNLIVQGDIANPRSYIIKNANGAAVFASGGANLYAQGFSVEATGSTGDYTPAGIGFFADRGGAIVHDTIAFGPCSQMQILVSGSGVVYPWQGASGKYSIYGASPYHVRATTGGSFTNARNTITITGNPTFSGCFYLCESNGNMNAWSATFTGTIVGRKYIVNTGAIINMSGTGDSSIPGTIAGIVDAATYGMLI